MAVGGKLASVQTCVNGEMTLKAFGVVQGGRCYLEAREDQQNTPDAAYDPPWPFLRLVRHSPRIAREPPSRGNTFSLSSIAYITLPDPCGAGFDW